MFVIYVRICIRCIHCVHSYVHNVRRTMCASICVCLYLYARVCLYEHIFL